VSTEGHVGVVGPQALRIGFDRLFVERLGLRVFGLGEIKIPTCSTAVANAASVGRGPFANGERTFSRSFGVGGLALFQRQFRLLLKHGGESDVGPSVFLAAGQRRLSSGSASANRCWGAVQVGEVQDDGDHFAWSGPKPFRGFQHLSVQGFGLGEFALPRRGPPDY